MQLSAEGVCLCIHLPVYLSIYLLQLLGVAIRADMPISLDLLPSFWKSLKKERLELSALREADCITYNLTQKMLDVSVCVCEGEEGRGGEGRGGKGRGGGMILI